MNLALSYLNLTSISFIQSAVNSIISAGFFISICGLVGLLGSGNESQILIFVHLVFLGCIVVLEFSVGVTLMSMKKAVSAELESSDCNNMCAASFDNAILDYALPSAGLMMTVIFVEALMIYSSIRLYFFIKDRQRVTVVTGPSVVLQNVQMQNADGLQTSYSSTPPAAYSTQVVYTTHQPQVSYVHQVTPGAIQRSQSDIEDKPPDYDSLSHFPPPYTNEMQHGATGTTSAIAGRSKDTEDNFNQV